MLERLEKAISGSEVICCRALSREARCYIYHQNAYDDLVLLETAVEDSLVKRLKNSLALARENEATKVTSSD